MKKSNANTIATTVIYVIMCLVTITLPAQIKATYQEAQQKFARQSFDEAYRLYEISATLYLEEDSLLQFLDCRIAMAECSQFGAAVSRQDIAGIIQPALDVIASHPWLETMPQSAKSYQILARYNWSVNGNYTEAEKNYQKSIDLAIKIGKSANEVLLESLSDLSHVYSNQEDFVKAIALADSALQLAKKSSDEADPSIARRYYSLGFTYYRSGRYDQAITEIRKGISWLEEIGGPEMQIGLGYNNLSAVYVAKVDLAGTLESSNRARQILTKYLDPNHEAFGNINYDLAVLYADLEKYQLAENYARKAINIYESRFGTNFPQLHDLYHLLGFCLDRLKKFRDAQTWHDKGLTLKIQTFGDAHPRTIESYRRVALHYHDADMLFKAQRMIDRGFEALDKSQEVGKITEAWLWDMQGMIYVKSNALRSAAEAFKKAISSTCQQGHITDVEASFNPFFFTEFQEKLAQVYADLISVEGPMYLDSAISAAQLAHAGIRRLRWSYQGNDSKLFLQKRARGIYDLFLDLLYQKHLLTGDSTYLARAWEISEQSKSLSILESWKSTEALTKTLPAEARDTLERLKVEMAYRQSQLMESPEFVTSDEQELLQDAYYSASNKLQAFQAELMRSNPSFRTAWIEFDPVPLAEVQMVLGPKQGMLQYYWADSALHIFFVTAGHQRWRKVALGAEFEQQINRLMTRSRDLTPILEDPTQALADYLEMASQVRDIIFPADWSSDLELLDAVMITPDRELGYLSFDAIPWMANPLTYLMEKLSVSQIFSASLFHHLHHLPEPDAQPRVAGFVPEYADMEIDSMTSNAVASVYREGANKLPGAREEVKMIMNIMPGQSWMDDDATEENFKSFAENFEILHLAMHGIVDEENPAQSKLLLGATAKEDGHLKAHEISNLKLQARLAVLSACHTGSGKLAVGEGILSLSRAFAMAGVPNILASLWRADDRSASQIMVGFYQGLDAGLPAVDALRQAKIKYLEAQRNPTTAHPYFWAPYVFVGANETFYDPNMAWLPILGGLLLLATLIYFGKRTLK